MLWNYIVGKFADSLSPINQKNIYVTTTNFQNIESWPPKGHLNLTALFSEINWTFSKQLLV